MSVKTPSLADAVRARVKQSQSQSESAQELLVFLETAEAEAVGALLTGGGLLSFTRDNGLDDSISDIVAAAKPDNAANEKAILALDDENVQNHIWSSRWNHNRAAYCLGLAIGTLLGGKR